MPAVCLLYASSIPLFIPFFPPTRPQLLFLTANNVAKERLLNEFCKMISFDQSPTDIQPRRMDLLSAGHPSSSFPPSSSSSPSSSLRFGGAITAALYLSEFISPVKKNKSDEKDGKDGKDENESTDGKEENDGKDRKDEKDEKDGKEGKDGKDGKDGDDGGGEKKVVWFHVDFMGSKGGSAEPQGMRAVFEYIKSEYAIKEI